MSLGKIAPMHRSVVRWHGWLLAAWVFAVGWLASWALLRLGVESPMWRWPLAMLVMYGLGFIGGCYFYVRWQQDAAQTGQAPARADRADEEDYDEEDRTKKRRMEWLADAVNLGSLAELFPPLLIVVAPLIVVALILLVVMLPWLVSEMLAGFLAELILEFVIGAAVMRRVLRPRPLDDSPSAVAARTWWLGLLAVVIAAGLGYAAHRLAPEAVTLGQLLRSLR
ncbi:hypothetical protein ACO2Q9_19910 [Variovorax sp. VNK109]|uniref:hypothetical protein n=1 Tax=Variovorax sp. VNK109 TaxID=3400919 RepID=UPI003C0E11C3